MQLKQGALLQGGKYKIEKVLGQGGFGITYLATQDILDRKVAIKEFFFKEFCEREDGTCTVSQGTQSNKTLVKRFLNKFIKEAKTISTLHHPNIIQIHDIFRENNTAYYVMDYIDGKSLGDIVKERGALPETKAVEAIKHVAAALEYIHSKSINHLDVKPNNIMLSNDEEKIILIDFGVAKQYDETTKEGTTTTPVGVSCGFSPLEQYKHNGVSSFSPESDIYSLGATLYKLVTGITPPEAIEVAQEGLPKMPSHLSDACKSVIRKSMMLNRADRPHNIAQFLEILNSKSQAPASSVESASSVEEETMPVVEKEETIYGGASVDEQESLGHDKIDDNYITTSKDEKSNQLITKQKKKGINCEYLIYVVGAIILSWAFYVWWISYSNNLDFVTGLLCCIIIFFSIIILAKPKRVVNSPSWWYGVMLPYVAFVIYYETFWAPRIMESLLWGVLFLSVFVVPYGLIIKYSRKLSKWHWLFAIISMIIPLYLTLTYMVYMVTTEP